MAIDVNQMDEMLTSWENGNRNEDVIGVLEKMTPLQAAYFGSRFVQHFSDDHFDTSVFSRLIEAKEG